MARLAMSHWIHKSHSMQQKFSIAAAVAKNLATSSAMMLQTKIKMWSLEDKILKLTLLFSSENLLPQPVQFVTCKCQN